MIGRWIVGVGLLFGILLMTLPKTDEESLAKIASTSILMCTLDFREGVAKQVIHGTAVTGEFANKCPDLITSMEMDDKGAMVITGNKHPLKMTLAPVVEGGKVRWSCQVEPASAMPKLCRP